MDNIWSIEDAFSYIHDYLNESSFDIIKIIETNKSWTIYTHVHSIDRELIFPICKIKPTEQIYHYTLKDQLKPYDYNSVYKRHIDGIKKYNK